MQAPESSRIVLAVAPNGGRRTKQDHPAIPLTAQELAEEAAACRDAGAAMFHLHVRDASGGHSLSAELCREAIAAIRGAVGDSLVIQITTEAVGRYAPPEQIAVVRAVRPEAVSLALRELAPSEAEKGSFADFLAWLHAERIAPQIILYSRGEVDRLLQWAAEGVLDAAQTSVLFVLGRYTEGQRSNPVDLIPFLGVGALPFRDWMVCAFGPNEPRCAALAGILGGHVRVGFENNLHLPDGRLAASNAELVRETGRMLEALRLGLAGADELRSLWRIG